MRRVRVYLALVLALSVVFGLVYFGAAWLAARSGSTLRFYLPWELAIPFIPEAVWVYFSIALLFLLPLFTMDEQQMRLLARQFALGTAMAGVVFLVWPARTGFEPEPVDGVLATVFGALRTIDGPFNTAPSLHVTYGTLLLLTLLCRTHSASLRALYVLWLVALAMSVVLVHQHHVFDVISGLALGSLLARPLCSPRARSGHRA